MQHTYEAVIAPPNVAHRAALTAQPSTHWYTLHAPTAHVKRHKIDTLYCTHLLHFLKRVASAFTVPNHKRFFPTRKANVYPTAPPHAPPPSPISSHSHIRDHAQKKHRSPPFRGRKYGIILSSLQRIPPISSSIEAAEQPLHPRTIRSRCPPASSRRNDSSTRACCGRTSGERIIRQPLPFAKVRGVRDSAVAPTRTSARKCCVFSRPL